MRGRIAPILMVAVVLVAGCGTAEDAGPGPSEATTTVTGVTSTTSEAGTTTTAPITTTSAASRPSRDSYGRSTMSRDTTTTTGAATSTTVATSTTTTGASSTTTAPAVSTTSPPATTTTTQATTSTSEAETDEARIEIEAFSFGEPLVVPPGTTVTVVNRDSVAHTWTSTGGLFDSGRLDPGDSFTYVFGEPGEYSFFCEIHPSMTGSITVRG